MTHHPNTPASRNEEVAAVLQSILADACDSESETNVPAELYRRGVEALAASRTEQAAPSVASGVEKDEVAALQAAINLAEVSHSGMSYGDDKGGGPSEYTRGWGDCLKAIKSAASVSMTTDGWQLVPPVPSKEMVEAAADAPEMEDAKQDIENMWRAMLAAAPGAATAAREQEAVKREFTNELGNAIRITIEGPSSASENVLTPKETEQLRAALNAHASREEAPAASAVLALHPATADLVHRFAKALAEKLAKAEKKYGYSDGWLAPHWMDECRTKLLEHIDKGDPRDVAAYCAFLWHHGESTAPTAARSPATVAQPVECPTCGAPCNTRINPRGGDYGWGTTDKERTVYRYAQPCPSQGCGGDGGEVQSSRFTMGNSINRYCRAGMCVEPSICFEDERGDYGDEDRTPVFEELIKKSDFESALQSALKDRDAEIERLKKDAERLEFMCSKAPLRFIEGNDDMWRVYQDEAPPEACAHKWRAIVAMYYPTAREAIDAAIDSMKGDAS